MKLAVALLRDLRGAAVQAVGPVRHGEGGASVIKINEGSDRPLGDPAACGSPPSSPSSSTSRPRPTPSTVGDITLASSTRSPRCRSTWCSATPGSSRSATRRSSASACTRRRSSSARYGWSQGWTFFVAAAIAFVVGCLVALPALRLKGIYLALVTLALAVLFPTLVRWDKLEWLTEGPAGIDGVTYDDIPDWPLLGELRGREGRAVFIYWLGGRAARDQLPRLPGAS